MNFRAKIEIVKIESWQKLGGLLSINFLKDLSDRWCCFFIKKNDAIWWQTASPSLYLQAFANSQFSQSLFSRENSKFSCRTCVWYSLKLSRAATGIKKKYKLYDYNPKFLWCLKVKMTLRSKFFNQLFLNKCSFRVFTL